MPLRTLAIILRYLAFTILLITLISLNPPAWTIILVITFIAATAVVDTLSRKPRRQLA